MLYVPAFAETVLVLLASLAVLMWVARRSPAARSMAPLLIGAVLLPTLWGGIALWSEDLSAVTTARYTAMGAALVGLLVSVGWAFVVRGAPAVEDEA